MMNLTYRGNPSEPNKIAAIIGNDVVFDAGGINIKGTGAFFLEVMFVGNIFLFFFL